MTLLRTHYTSFASLILAALLSAGLLLATGCSRNEAVNQNPPEAGDVAVARVNGLIIWASDVRLEAVAQGQIGEGEPLDITSDLFRRTLEDVIYRKLMAEAARKEGLERSSTAQRRLMAAQDRILADMLVENTLDGAIDEGKVRALYDEQVKLSKTSEEIRARMIVVKTRAEADNIVKLLGAGGLFEALAMERSIDQSTRFNGGDLGYISSDLMPQALKGALSNAAVGQVVGPVETDGGWVVLRVEDRRPEVPLTYEESRPQIMRFLTFDQLRVLLTQLREAAKVEILIPNLKQNDQPPANAPQSAPQNTPPNTPPNTPQADTSSSASKASSKTVALAD